MNGIRGLIALLTGVAICVIAIALTTGGRGGVIVNPPGLGKDLSPGLNMDDVMSIRITRPGGSSVILAEDKDIWRVKDLYDYPAGHADIARLIRGLAEAKVIQYPRSGVDDLKRFDLLAPGQGEGAGAEVTLFGENGAELTSIRIGKTRIRKSVGRGNPVAVGRYVMSPKEKRVLLINRLLPNVDNAAEAWLDHRFVALPSLRAAELIHGKQLIWSARADAMGKSLRLENTDPMKPADPEKLKKIDSCLAKLTFITIARPTLTLAETGLDNPYVFTGVTYYGVQCRLMIGKPVDNAGGATASARYVKVAIRSTSEATPFDLSGLTPEQRKRVSAKLAKLQEDAALDQAEFGRWTYVVSEKDLKPMLYTRTELLTRDSKPAGPGSIALPMMR